jgi:TIR domain
MAANPFVDELRRIRADFEAQASKYHDVTLTVYYLEDHNKPSDLPLPRPHHAINLWQIIGTTSEALENFDPTGCTRFGFTRAEVTALAVIAGPETNLFVKMAHRAASIIPAEIQTMLNRLVGDWLLKITKEAFEQETDQFPMIATNSNPLAVWLNLMMASLVTFQPERVRPSGLTVDPFTGSLAALDMLLGRYSSRSVKVANPFAHRRFQVALSFPGEKRTFVESVAQELRARGIDVFYDKYFEAELAVLDLDLRLQSIYHDHTDLIVIFVCAEYEKKDWCGLEFRAIRDLIKKRQADVLLMRFDDAHLPGVLSIDGYVDLRGRTPEQAVEVISRRI